MKCRTIRYFLNRQVFLLMLLFTPWMATHAADKTNAGQLTLVSAGNLTVCMDPTYPPLEFFRQAGDKDPVGFDVDMSQEIATQLGLALRIMKADFAGLLSSVQAGRCDVVISGATVQEKRTKILPAIPYLQTGRAILVRKGEQGIRTPEDLSGKTVAVQAGTTFVTIMERLNEKLKQGGKPLALVQIYPKATEVFEQLRNGRASAIITGVTEIAYRETVTPGLFEMAYDFPEKEPLGIYFKADVAMNDALVNAVKQLRLSGKTAELAKKWGLPPANANF